MNSVQLNFQNLKPFGIADLTTSTALDAVPHSQLSRDDICLVAAATSTIAQLGVRGSGLLVLNLRTLNLLTLNPKRGLPRLVLT
jgi:hypothetical protein